MKAKKYLNNLHRLNNLIEQKHREMEELEAMALTIPAIDCTREVVQTSKSPNAQYTTLIHKLVEMNKYTNELIDFYVDEKKRIIEEIESIEHEPHARLLYLRYVENMSLENIAKKMHQSLSWVKKNHVEALKMFDLKLLC